MNCPEMAGVRGAVPEFLGLPLDGGPLFTQVRGIVVEFQFVPKQLDRARRAEGGGDIEPRRKSPPM